MTTFPRSFHHRPACGTVAAVMAFLTPVASAHMTVDGAGELGNGALHPLTTPSHVLILLGLALLLGQQVPLDPGKRWKVFAPVSAAALGFTATGMIGEMSQPVLLSLALCIAALVAVGKKLPRFVPEFSCFLAAAGIGLDSAVETGGPVDIFKTLIGTWLAMNALVFYIAICASNGAEKQWARVGIRVLGSWIIAISLMAVAFSLRG